LIVVVIALLLGVGGYLIGKESGEDLDQARSFGEAAGIQEGREKGQQKGLKAGFDVGRTAGFNRTYGPAYRRAYRRQFDEAGLEAPGVKEIEVKVP
jgi:hypothetical protein